jgi:hypothetical protein
MGLILDFLQCISDIGKAVCGPLFQQPYRGCCIVRNRSQRLVEFMGHGGGHFTHHAQAAYVNHFLTLPQGFFLTLALFSQITDQADETPCIACTYFAYSYMGREATAILTLRLDFAANANDPAYAGFFITIEVIAMAGFVCTHHKNADGLANEFVRPVAKHIACDFVDAFYGAVFVDNDHRLYHRIEHRIELYGS